MKTSGGAVLVGRVIENDEGNYCLKLDETMTFGLTNTAGDSILFENCDKILLCGPSEDEIDKSSYEDMDVTIKGILQNDPGAGRFGQK